MVVGYSNINADGYINDVNPYSANTATPSNGQYAVSTLYYGGIQGVNGTSWITVDGDKKLNITKDTKILNIDSAADKDEEIGKQGTALLTAQEIASSGKYYVNAYYIMDEAMGANDEDADLAFIVVDLKGKMDGKNETSTINTTIANCTNVSLTNTDNTAVTKLEAGKSYKLTFTPNATAAAKTKITLSGAVFADTSKAEKAVTLTANSAVTYTVIATSGAFGVTLS